MSDHWTPDLVQEAISEALRWLRHAGANDGPRSYGSGMPKPALSIEERLAAGWDAVADSDDAEVRLNPDRAQIARYESALLWVPDILAPIDEDMARMVNVYCACKAFSHSFSRNITIDRASAYRLKDNGLVRLSVALDRRGEPVWQTNLNA